jgi:hypothetical protein
MRGHLEMRLDWIHMEVRHLVHAVELWFPLRLHNMQAESTKIPRKGDHKPAVEYTRWKDICKLPCWPCTLQTQQCSSGTECCVLLDCLETKTLQTINVRALWQMMHAPNCTLLQLVTHRIKSVLDAYGSLFQHSCHTKPVLAKSNLSPTWQGSRFPCMCDRCTTSRPCGATPQGC